MPICILYGPHVVVAVVPISLNLHLFSSCYARFTFLYCVRKYNAAATARTELTTVSLQHFNMGKWNRFKKSEPVLPSKHYR